MWVLFKAGSYSLLDAKTVKLGVSFKGGPLSRPSLFQGNTVCSMLLLQGQAQITKGLVMKTSCFRGLFVCLNGLFPEKRKDDIPSLGILPHVWGWRLGQHPLWSQSWEQNNIHTSLGKVKSQNAGNWTWHLFWHQAAMQTMADWNSVCPWRNLGVLTTPSTQCSIFHLNVTLFAKMEKNSPS